jgi:hypothetical protein
MPTPRAGAPELQTSQAGKEETVNEIARYLEAGGNIYNCFAIGTNSPPGSPTDGILYVVGGTPTGAWSAFTPGNVALYISTAWVQITGREGVFAYDQTANKLYKNDGAGGIAAWVEYTTSGSPATINAQSGTTYTLVLADAQNIVELTNASAITLTVPPNASVAFPVGTVIELHQGGAGDVTVAAGVGVTLNSRGSAFDLAGIHAIAALRKVAINTWRLTGDIV